MKKWMTTATVATGVMIGAIVGGTLGPGLAGATEDGLDPRPGPRAAWIEEALTPLVTDGTLTDAQADAVVGALVEAHIEHRAERGPWGDRIDPDRAREHLAEAVADGRITQERADEILEHLERRREAIDSGEVAERREEFRDRLRDRLRERRGA